MSVATQNSSCFTIVAQRFVIASTLIILSCLSAIKAVAADGAQLYQQCIACHGAQGQGNESLGAPALAGQFDQYLLRQLQHFSQEIRGNEPVDTYGKQMQAIAQSLSTKSAQELQALTLYIQSLPSQKALNDATGDLKNGSRYYHGKCGACHGGQGQGNQSFSAPKLAGLSNRYLKRQMANFVSGVRGSHAKDKYGRQMAMMAKTTSGTELDDILFYLSQQ